MLESSETEITEESPILKGELELSDSVITVIKKLNSAITENPTMGSTAMKQLLGKEYVKRNITLDEFGKIGLQYNIFDTK